MSHGPGRRQPYTPAGLRRVPCVRCGAPSGAQWQICADKRLFRPICNACDILMNEMVMRWIWGDSREDDLQRYRIERQT